MQVRMYSMHARIGASEAPRTHFRASKISKKFLGHAPRPPSHNVYYGSHFVYLPWAPTILSVALSLVLEQQ